MKKTSESGKKRRSKSFWNPDENATPLSKMELLRKEYELYKRTSSSLSEVFNAIDRKKMVVSSADLKKRIASIQESILALEGASYIKRKTHKQKYRTFEQAHIRNLSEFIKNTPVFIEAGFSSHLVHKFSRDISKLSRDMLKGIREKRRQALEIDKKYELEFTQRGRLPYLRFEPLIKADAAETDDDIIKKHLVYGVIDYLQKLMFNDTDRIFRCSYSGCKRWFTRKNIGKKTCSPAHKDAYWREANGGHGRKKRAKIQKGYRKSLKNKKP